MTGFLTADEQARLERAVAAAENRTTAEIKVAIVRHSWGDSRDRAAQCFRRLGLADTAQRNCVLLLVIAANREFVIYGDEGIHQQVGQSFWDDVRDLIADHFRRGDFGGGLVAAVERVGQQLAAFYPASPHDRNEIGNEVASDP